MTTLYTVIAVVIGLCLVAVGFLCVFVAFGRISSDGDPGGFPAIGGLALVGLGLWLIFLGGILL